MQSLRLISWVSACALTPTPGAQLQKTWRSTKKGVKRRRNPRHRRQPPSWKLYPLPPTSWRSTNSGDELNLWHLHCQKRRCVITGTSQPTNCTCGSSRRNLISSMICCTMPRSAPRRTTESPPQFPPWSVAPATICSTKYDGITSTISFQICGTGRHDLLHDSFWHPLLKNNLDHFSNLLLEVVPEHPHLLHGEADEFRKNLHQILQASCLQEIELVLPEVENDLRASLDLNVCSARQPTSTDSEHWGRQTPRKRNPSRARSNTDLDLHLCPNKRPRLTKNGQSSTLSKNCTCGKYRTSCSTSTYRHDLWHWQTTRWHPRGGQGMPSPWPRASSILNLPRRTGKGTQEGSKGCQAPEPSHLISATYPWKISSKPRSPPAPRLPPRPAPLPPPPQRRSTPEPFAGTPEAKPGGRVASKVSQEISPSSEACCSKNLVTASWSEGKVLSTISSAIWGTGITVGTAGTMTSPERSKVYLSRPLMLKPKVSTGQAWSPRWWRIPTVNTFPVKAFEATMIWGTGRSMICSCIRLGTRSCDQTSTTASMIWGTGGLEVCSNVQFCTRSSTIGGTGTSKICSGVRFCTRSCGVASTTSTGASMIRGTGTSQICSSVQFCTRSCGVASTTSTRAGIPPLGNSGTNACRWRWATIQSFCFQLGKTRLVWTLHPSEMDIDRNVDMARQQSHLFVEASPTASERKEITNWLKKIHQQIGHRDNRTLVRLLKQRGTHLRVLKMAHDHRLQCLWRIQTTCPSSHHFLVWERSWSNFGNRWNALATPCDWSSCSMSIYGWCWLHVLRFFSVFEETRERSNRNNQTAECKESLLKD